MKSTLISLAVVLILMVALPMIFLGDNSIADKFNFGLGSTAGSQGMEMPGELESVTTDSTVRMYKWRDAHGILQFSHTPPDDGNAELIELKPNLTTVDSIKPRVEKTAITQSVPEISHPYSPGGMKQMVEQTNALKDILSQQQADKQKALEGITRSR